MVVLTSLMLTCLPVVFRVHNQWQHAEQINVASLRLANLSTLLHATPVILGSNWR